VPEGFDGLTCEWGSSNYVNPPFGSIIHQGKKKGPTFWIRKAIAEHEVLQMVLQTEPALLEPTFSAIGSTTRDRVAQFLMPYVLAATLAPGRDPEAVADYLARMFLSYMGAPGRWDLTESDQVKSLVEYELLGGILAS
jgi:hypothetical protein